MTKFFYFVLLYLFVFNTIIAQSLYKGNGNVSFISDAPLETVKAHSTKLDGIMDLNKKLGDQVKEEIIKNPLSIKTRILY